MGAQFKKSFPKRARYFWGKFSFSTLFFNWTLWSFMLYFSLNETTMDFCSLAEFGFSFLLIIFASVYSYTK